MARIARDPNNIFAIPSGSTVDKKGYVYINTSTEYKEKKDGSGKYTTHGKKCIGTSIDRKKMYANAAYIRMFRTDVLPEPPERPDSIVVGTRALVGILGMESGLISILKEVFPEEDACLILDLASYMLTEESAVFQHYPKWARRHALFSETVRSDSFISTFLSNCISVSRIRNFTKLWGSRHIGSGHVYLCYDSTNTNSRAEGVFLVEKGHAKDDPDVPQVNTDYVLRQEDGLPLTFLTFPGSIVDISEAPEMIRLIREISDKRNVYVTIVCDRGYISKPNIDCLDENHIDFLLMLRSNLNDSKELISEYGDSIRNSHKAYMTEYDKFGITVRHQLFEEGGNRYFHIIWDPTLEAKDRKKLMSSIETKEKYLAKAIDRKTAFSMDEINRLCEWFNIEYDDADPVTVKAKGRGKARTKKEEGFIITKASKSEARISNSMAACGFFILATSKRMTAQKAYEEYAKRDCVEKVFRALKSNLGMDSIGVHTDDAIHGKSLVWFVAAILRSLLFNRLSALRISDRKTYTVPASIDLLDEIVADRDITSGKYERRYQFTAKQKAILNACGVTSEDIGTAIENLTA